MKSNICAYLLLIFLIINALGFSERVIAAPAPEAAASLQGNIFYDRLGTDGRWISHDRLGWVWTPYNVPSDWRPTLSVIGSILTMAGRGSRMRNGAGRPTIMVAGILMQTSDGSGLPVRCGGRHGFHGAMVEVISAGRRYLPRQFGMPAQVLLSIGRILTSSSRRTGIASSRSDT